MMFLAPIVVASAVAGTEAGACEVQFLATLSEWSAAAPNANVAITFDEASWPVNVPLAGPWTVGGVTLVGNAGVPFPNIYIANFGSPFGTGQWCTANGDEDINILPPVQTRALAFDAASNRFGQAFVRVYNAVDALIGALEIPVNSIRFVGIVSSVPIGRVNFTSVLGAIANTGFDTVRVSQTATSIPADLNHDGVVNGADLGLLLASWGPGGAADLDCDGTVSGSDLGLLLSSWTV